MANIARYNPIDDLFNEFSKGFFVRPFAGMPEAAEPKMKLDVKEDEKAYTVRADIPGVKKEDIQIDVDANARRYMGAVTAQPHVRDWIAAAEAEPLHIEPENLGLTGPRRDGQRGND